MTPVVLLVASPGGHLNELVDFAARLPDSLGHQIWVTSRTAQTETLLAGLDVEFVASVGARQGLRAAQSLPVAMLIIRNRRPAFLLSTGAALSVPFMVAARALHVRTHYIESATRLTGPSMTGRIAQRLPGIRLHHQGGPWTSRRWQPIAGVFDGYALSEDPASGVCGTADQPRGPRCFVMLGTERFSFSRAVTAIDAALPADAEVVWQLGHTAAPRALSGSVYDWMPTDALNEAVRDADVVITHAGVGSILNALRAGKAPVVLPRRESCGEHVDDHQVELSDMLRERGIVLTAETAEEVSVAIKAAQARSIRKVDLRALPSPI